MKLIASALHEMSLLTFDLGIEKENCIPKLKLKRWITCTDSFSGSNTDGPFTTAVKSLGKNP